MKRKSLEADLQKAVVIRLAYLRNQGHLRFFAVGNGGTRHLWEAVNMKAQGVVAGVPDICLLLPAREYVGVRAPASTPRVIFLELKAGKNKLTAEQKDWSEWLVNSGFAWFEIRSLDDVERILSYYIPKVKASVPSMKLVGT